MIQLKSLTMKNFLSVGAVTLPLNLDEFGLTLIIGHNIDVNGVPSKNGAGKTTLLQAISYVLYGKPLSKIKIPNLCNNINGKGMLVTLTFERDGIEYVIERGAKPAVMRFFVNKHQVKLEEDNEAQGENRHTQAAIERAICMTHTMFKHIIAINTATDPFLRLSTALQRDIIEELLGITQIGQRAEALKSSMVDTKDTLRDQHSSIRATKEANTRIENAIVAAITTSNRWSKDHNSSLATMEEEINAMKNIDYDNEILIFDSLEAWVSQNKTINDVILSANREIKLLKREISNIEGEIERLKKDSKTDISSQILRFEQENIRKSKEITRKSESLLKDNIELEKLQLKISNPNEHTCESCNQKLVGTEHLNTVLANLKAIAEKLKSKINREQNEIADFEIEIAHIIEEIRILQETTQANCLTNEIKIAEKNKLLVDPKTKIIFQENLLKTQEELTLALGKKPSSIFSSRDEIYKTKGIFDALIHERDVALQKQNPYETQIESLSGTLQTIEYEPINRLDVLYKHQEFLMKLLTSKDSFIRKKIIDKNLAYLNSRLDHYLDKLGLPHQVKFLNDLSVEINLLGNFMDFEQLSRGEMNRLIMATSWGFRDVWESLNESVNLIFIDEMLDNGLDEVGSESALAILKYMAREQHKNIFLISHKDSMSSRVDHILTVTKEGGFTTFDHG